MTWAQIPDPSSLISDVTVVPVAVDGNAVHAASGSLHMIDGIEGAPS